MQPDFINEIKELIASCVDLGGVDLSQCGPDTPLFGTQGFALDSIDAVELLVALQKKYGIGFETMHQGREMFRNLGALADYVSRYRTL